MSLQISAIVLKNKSALGKAYRNKAPIGRILIIYQDIQQGRKRFNTLLIAAYKYNKVLNQKLLRGILSVYKRRSNKTIGEKP